MSVEAIAPLGLTLLVLQQPFMELLRKVTPAHFASSLLTALGGFAFQSLFIGPLLVFFKMKAWTREGLKETRGERKRVGYWRYALFIWLFALWVDIGCFLAMRLTLWGTLFYWQVVIVAVVGATCVSVFHLFHVGVLDRWIADSPTQ